jgi:hypothetical protein
MVFREENLVDRLVQDDHYSPLCHAGENDETISNGRGIDSATPHIA